MVTVYWAEFEQAGIDAIALAIAKVQGNFPREELYAGAFWLLYGDYNSLHVPAFGLNGEAHATMTDKSGRVIDIRWHPPDWKWCVVDEAVERMRPLYRPFLDLDISPEDFEELWESHAAMLARVCRMTTDFARTWSGMFADLSLPSGFLVGIIDWAQGDELPELLRLSLSEEVLAKHDELRLEAQRI